MFYVANVITFSVFLDILQKSTVLIRYKLNRFRTPWVNQLIYVHFYLEVMPNWYLSVKWFIFVNNVDDHFNRIPARSPNVNAKKEDYVTDISALLFGSYARFIPLDKMVFYGYSKSLPSVSFSMLHIALTLFPLCNGLCCSRSN